MKLRAGLIVGALGLGLAAPLVRDAASGTIPWPASAIAIATTATRATIVPAPRPAWSEIKWPFPIDEWGTGQAYRCAPADCGGQVDLYLRAKVGFCNCATGVSDDDDLDRVSDLELFSGQFAGLAAGRPVDVGRMKGRVRLYRVVIPYGAPRDMLAIGFNDQCDVAVATVVAAPDRLARAEGLALEFLNTAPVLRWAAAELGRNGI